jgi:endonuclease G, mitochondrial
MRSTALLVLVVLVAFAAGRDALSAPGCADHLPYGAPLDLTGDAGDTIVLCKRAASRELTFKVVHYDRDRVAPRWVAYHLSRSKMFAASGNDLVRGRHAHEFIPDSLLDLDGRFDAPTHDDFTGAGHDRGHLAPAEAMKWDREAYRATFKVSNIALQASRFNRVLWNRLESQMQGWACDFGTLYVITGVIFADDDSPTHPLRHQTGMETHIPTHFYKLLYTPAHGDRAIAFVFENRDDAGPLEAGAVTVRSLETMTGLDFFPDMPVDRQEAIETAEPGFELWRTDYPGNFRCDAAYLSRDR